MTVIGFIGLGNMGGPMSANLAQAGHRVRGFDLSAEAVATAAEAGVEAVASGAEAATGADIVVTMLPSGSHVLDCYGTNGGLLAAASPDTLFVDCSTIDVAHAREAAQMARAAGHRALDAPVSGGVVGATAGTLAFMVGGPEGDFAAAGPLLEAMGRRVVHCGESGAGQVAKMCNNMILAASTIAVSEAFVLGEKLGLSHQALYDVAANASGQCWSLSVNCPVPGPVPTSPANNDYRPGFATQLMIKDLGLARAAAEAAGVDAAIGLHAARMYEEFGAAGGIGRDFSAIITAIRDRSESDGAEPGE
ncbi:3-hydroxyisobutyrate dehydrogenase [Nocardiopsis ansamitocini]|uniref:3-hydroxyisobutyrate dehydrogenase n=1 Tax=Nocardiopsis ansamitocini TaxID=1670832 RepID=A0A9W6P815_9ACTN|nr:3-hydroxyisobutyrate dehydrogenase [Nocardiopsis ansamitocini]GLU48759.1 3-hydroxyisobutyrate dehydrogenase [Nocardiopsis ansamitocini]